MKTLFVAVSLFFASSAAMAQIGTAGSAQRDVSEPRETVSSSNSQDSGEAAERRICRQIDVTGSRLGSRRVCMTRSQWREFDRQN